MKAVRSISILCLLLLISAVVSADPGRGAPGPSAEPKRSYGSIGVIMYQTSW